MAQALQQLGWKHGLHIGADRVALVNFLQRRGALRRMAWQRLARGLVDHSHQVFLVHGGVLANQLARDASVLREHQQANRVNIEPPGRCQTAQLGRRETVAAGVIAPVGARVDQRHGRRVAVLCLAAHIAHGLVQQDGDALVLKTLRDLVHVDAVGGQHLHAHFRHLAIDLDPALGNPVVGLAPRAQAQLGHALVQARCGHAGCSARTACRAFASRRRAHGRLADRRHKPGGRRAVVGWRRASCGPRRCGAPRGRGGSPGAGLGRHRGKPQHRAGGGRSCGWITRLGDRSSGRASWRTGTGRRHGGYFRLWSQTVQ